MARDTTIALSEDEKESLDSVRDDIFGTDEVPYGTVVEHLIEEHFSGGD